ncbi:conserved hypothetical protein [Streptomyces scabiei 87.22]|uniref:Uncharacterized protein n=1 Tax=Streptomyces scabiei (strain 87.22) TaxID=680198 RepID=C9Z0X1_STRSW|nr:MULTISPECIES: DUF2786 domain-containing protein [Streptomyces]MBP5862075.1 DUF2786 domain-containing protein [Streptomyces sp. LBUM 1484]MBP5929631.1 DUF2786 domain-containing protein [Streptomyces sp. LBUM 1479]MBP5877468.1 DUF2786 domain-containing protein [Streptomyces sp. LBUM 1477]MBP5891876.1 DUF2786 domain-containing protein [Streptomyces sp. LBUM 1481]MBP5901272.1 DUF2786 domain-containing protein [Streptomyces sp. LBUM 1488]
MSTTSTVDRAFEAALYADTDTALDTGASLLAADPAADAELARRGREFVAGAWRRGWQPADVVRFVRRELEDEHVTLLARLVVEEHEEDRGHAKPRSPGPRWAAQLDEIREQAAQRARADRFSYATTALELYRLLLRLPTLESLDGPRASGGAQNSPHPESRMLGRIRALLAKAEATGFPEEAEALSAKAQELMARHSIDEALLAARAHSADTPGACRIGVEPPYETAKAVLLDAVARANRCEAVWNEALGFSTVVGFEADLEVVELLHTSLLVQATTAMTRAEAAQRRSGRKRTKTFRQSFLAAYAHRIGDRLAEVAEAQVAEAEAGGVGAHGAGAAEQDLLPVLAARDVAVREQVGRMFPETVTTRVRGVSDLAGWQQGAEAADRAQVRARPRLPS